MSSPSKTRTVPGCACSWVASMTIRLPASSIGPASVKLRGAAVEKFHVRQIGVPRLQGAHRVNAGALITQQRVAQTQNKRLVLHITSVNTPDDLAIRLRACVLRITGRNIYIMVYSGIRAFLPSSVCHPASHGVNL